VHRRWEFVQRVDEQTLSEQESAEAARYPAGKVLYKPIDAERACPRGA
jgi:hypothetical protein